MAWTIPPRQTFGYTLLAADWNAALVTSMSYLGGSHDHKTTPNGGDGGKLRWPFCTLRKSAVQSISNGAYNLLTWDTEVSDVDGMHVAGDSKITIPISGKYLIWAQVAFASNATGMRELDIYGNGGYWEVPTLMDAVNGADTTLTMFYMEPLVATHYFQIYVWQNSGGSLNIQASTAAPQFGIFYIGG